MRVSHQTWIIAGFAAVALFGSNVRGKTPALASEVAEKVPGAERLEGRLLAPCCWNQTLDIHGSEIANTLRREIRSRLKSGDSPEVIEQDLVARYGERIRAVPDRVPLNMVGTLGWVGAAASAGFLGFVLWQWRKRGTSLTTSVGSTKAPGPRQSEQEASDERLDAELQKFDDTDP